MDTSQLETLVPGLGAFSAFSVSVVLLIRLLGHDRAQLATADARYQQEVKDHEATQAKLDEARQARREAEDAVAKLTREMQALTEQVARQTDQIRHLEQEVGRLNGTGAAV
ncbi:hypothetical protein [Micromonospora haikouensis]|uniref:hypothetical protein n=1 Tax=Micromonospora haikouensis TaxID=686309 RepID=UPI003D7658C6